MTFYLLTASIFLAPLLGQAQNRKTVADRPGMIFVFMQEFGTTKGSDPNPVLETVGAGPCIVVTLYDKISKVGTMTHLSPATDTRNLSEALRGMIASMYRAGYDDRNRNRVGVRIIGGHRGSSDELFGRIQRLLTNLGFSKPIEVDYGDWEAESVALDTRTGELFDLVQIRPFSLKSEEERLRSAIRDMQALMPYVHYTSDKKVKHYEIFTSAQ